MTSPIFKDYCPFFSKSMKSFILGINIKAFLNQQNHLFLGINVKGF
jgi:hypothetical protein